MKLLDIVTPQRRWVLVFIKLFKVAAVCVSTELSALVPQNNTLGMIYFLVDAQLVTRAHKNDVKFVHGPL